MQVKRKLFPYPIINCNKSLSNYGEKNFRIVFEPLEDEKSYILKNCKFESDSTLVNELYRTGKIGVAIIVECSNTVYRKSFEISKTGKDLILLKDDFVEKVDISLFAYAKKSFIMWSDEFEDDYKNINFEIEKYDIIGADDGFNIRFIHEEAKDNLVQSIFSIIPKNDLESGAYSVDYSIGRKIVISLSLEDHKNYKIIYTIPAYKEVFFNMILIPSLVEGLSLCKEILEDESKDLDDVENQYQWFNSIESAYKKLKGNNLQTQDFKTTSSVILAQELLGKPLGKALKNLVDETNKLGEEGDENE